MSKCFDHNTNNTTYKFQASKHGCEKSMDTVEKKTYKKINCIVYVRNTCELKKALQSLDSCTKIKLCKGTYNNVELCLNSSLLADSLELLGDDNSLSGVSFFSDACYSNDGLYQMPHLSCDIGKGKYKLVFDSRQNKVTVTAPEKTNPDFSRVSPYTKVKLMDKNGNSFNLTVSKSHNNELYFNEEINLGLLTNHDDCPNKSVGVALKGVGFTILPNVVFTSCVPGILSGVKCLRMVGIYFDFKNTELVYGENYSNIENCVFSNLTTVVSNARLAVNRAPNTIYGKFKLNNQTNNRFVFNSVLGKDGRVIADNCSGMFAYSMFIANDIAFKVVNNANMDGSFNKYYQVCTVNMYVVEGSKLKTSNSKVCFEGPVEQNPIGLVGRDNSIVVTDVKGSTNTYATFIRTIDGVCNTFKNAVDLKNNSFFYNWGGNPYHEIGSTDLTSQYYHSV